MKSLSECREEIDTINTELLRLLERRMRVSENVARYKLANGMKIFDETREAAILEKIGSLAPEDIRSELVGTFDGIMNMSKLRQYRLISQSSPSRELFYQALEDDTPIYRTGDPVGVQGIAGAYSHKAAMGMFPGADIRFYTDWAGVFAALKSGEISLGLLPVENSTYGSVSDVYRLIIDNDAYVVASDRLRVEHCLLAKPNVRIEDITEVTSHSQALGQCAGYIRSRGYKATSAINTAVAAENVASSDRNDLAAIASVDCAEKYGLCVLESGIQDEANNTTRFAAISSRLIIPRDADKISLRFSLAHREGTLARILGYFAALGLNLTKLESRPIPSKPFEYRFYLDFIGKMTDEPVFDLICALSSELPDFRFMGNYHEYSDMDV